MLGHRRPDGSARDGAHCGDFWKLSAADVPDFAEARGRSWCWCVCDPRGEVWQLGPSHWVQEHDGGTITVTPALNNGPEHYRGRLTFGVWA